MSALSAQGQEQCPFCHNYGAADSPLCRSCGKYKYDPDNPPTRPRDSVELGDLREAGEDDE